jgi:hypothetical protein
VEENIKTYFRDRLNELKGLNYFNENSRAFIFSSTHLDDQTGVYTTINVLNEISAARMGTLNPPGSLEIKQVEVIPFLVPFSGSCLNQDIALTVCRFIALLWIFVILIRSLFQAGPSLGSVLKMLNHVHVWVFITLLVMQIVVLVHQ